ncbi:MAG: hypothetical protein KAI34_04185 [Candidatus Lokiarchaeota archaeon]|nr:hypothetical protein [Candidatus Lokiarchaeota archaeon]
MKGNQLQEILQTAFDVLKNGKNAEERIEAASTIWNISISDQDALRKNIDTLGGYLTDTVPGVRGLIAWTLYTLSMKYPEDLLSQLDVIGDALLDSDLNVRRYAANILVELSRDFSEHIKVLTPTLAKALEDPSVDVRIAVEKIQQYIVAGKTRVALTETKKARESTAVKKAVSDIYEPRRIIDVVSISQRIDVIKDKVHYRLSVFNDSLSDISNVVCVVVSHPNVLRTEKSLMQQCPILYSNTMTDFEFIFRNTQDYLEGSIFATISFIDKQNIIHTISNEPYSVQFAYKFLRKLEKKSLDFYEEYIRKSEHSRPIEVQVHVRHVVGDDVFSRIKRILDEFNIQIIHEESETISDVFSGIIKGLSTSIIHRKIYALQFNIIGPLMHQDNTRYFALKFSISGPDDKIRSLISFDIRNEIMRYFQFAEDIKPSEPKLLNSNRESSYSDVPRPNDRSESKSCSNCGSSLPRKAKYCIECGELQYRSFNE